MRYINGYELQNLLGNGDPKVFFHLFKDPHKHPLHTPLSLAFIMTSDGEYYTTFTHPDYPEQQYKDLKLNNCLVYDLKSLRSTSVTLENCYDFGYETEIDYFSMDRISSFTNRIGSVPNITSIIPLSLHLVLFELLKDRFRDVLDGYIKNVIDNRFKRMYHDFIPEIFQSIESKGLKVDEEKFISIFEKPELIIDGLVYTHYNLYTSTGRPSNAFGGVNYAALNKHDGSRECFISRYEDGILVNLDFKSYHLHLIANEMNIKLPEDIHTEFGKLYFNIEYCDFLDPHLYDESKKITFKNLYGYEMDEMGKRVPFFNSVQRYKNSLWKTYQNEGILITKYGRKINVESDHSNVVFNYYIQALETETSAKQIYTMMQRGFIPILYTYDSMLFDIQKSRLESLLNVTNYLDYPFSISIGPNLQNLNKI